MRYLGPGMDNDVKAAIEVMRKNHADLRKKHDQALATLEKLNKVHLAVVKILSLRGTITRDEYTAIYADAKFGLPPHS